MGVWFGKTVKVNLGQVQTRESLTLPFPTRTSPTSHAHGRVHRVHQNQNQTRNQNRNHLLSIPRPSPASLRQAKTGGVRPSLVATAGANLRICTAGATFIEMGIRTVHYTTVRTSRPIACSTQHAQHAVA